jgi:hypothetical protein
MLDYLIGTANVVCLAGCVYIAYLLFDHARAKRRGTRQNRGKVMRDSDAGEQRAASPELDCYYMM